MAKMLRNSTHNHSDFGCCDHCARKSKPERKPGPRERRLMRAREKVRVDKEITSQRG